MGSESAAESITLLRRLINTDLNLSLRIHTLIKPYIPRSIFLLLEYSADFRLLFPLSLSFLLPSFLSPLILGFLLDLLLIGLIKVIFRRSRPPYNHHSSMSVAVSPDHYSFPSGHASRAFFVASLFHLSNSAITDMKGLKYLIRFFEGWICGDERVFVGISVLVVWSWAVATSMSRVFLGRHFLFDVLAGACLGVFEALVSFHFLRF